jgi:hypothetical protein
MAWICIRDIIVYSVAEEQGDYRGLNTIAGARVALARELVKCKFTVKFDMVCQPSRPLSAGPWRGVIPADLNPKEENDERATHPVPTGHHQD